MASILSELSYRELIKKNKKYGFRFYRSGKGSHELWVRDSDGKSYPGSSSQGEIN